MCRRGFVVAFPGLCMYLPCTTRLHDLMLQQGHERLLEWRTLGWQDVEVIDEDLGISGEGCPQMSSDVLISAVAALALH
jgi:hypothetical protein